MSASTRSAFLRPALFVLAAVLLVTAFSLLPTAEAYETYSTNGSTGNCATCHGDFRRSPYVSKVDGQSWADDLHDVHRNTMLSGRDCSTCHLASGRTPVMIGSAPGGGGLAGYSCSGCHGRSQDGFSASSTEGYGAGLRQRHWRAGETDCAGCHADSDPAAKTPVGEKVLPPFYANPGTNHPAIPTNPCSPAPAFTENFKGSTIGLDNDGNGLFDAQDPSCQILAATPGEAGSTASPAVVSAYNAATGDITVNFGVGCQTTGNTVYWGSLDQVATYAYSGQACGIGNTGSFTWRPPVGSGSIFFVIVGRDAVAEGSYGKTSAGLERPAALSNAACPLPQALGNSCN